MFSALLSVFGLISKDLRGSLLLLFLAILVSTVLEVSSLLLLGKFAEYMLSVLSGVEQQLIVYWLPLIGPFPIDPFGFFFVLSFVLITSFAAGLYSIKAQSYFAFRCGMNIGDRLFRNYSEASVSFHSSRNSAGLIKQIQAESTRITNGILLPCVQASAKLALSVGILVGLMVTDLLLTFALIGLFVGAYVLFFIFYRARLKDNGRLISSATEFRLKTMSEVFRGIKELRIANQIEPSIREFSGVGELLATGLAKNNIYGQAPKFYIETLVFLLVAFGLLMAPQVFSPDDSGKWIATFAVFGVGGLKLMPAMQQAYNSIVKVQGNIAAVYAVLDDTKKVLETHYRPAGKQAMVGVFKDLSLNAVWLRRSDLGIDLTDDSEFVLKDINVQLQSCQHIGLVGGSGAGKSTFIDVILGFYRPTSGSIIINGVDIQDTKITSWYDQIGFVPQDIFLVDASIAENIALCERDEICEKKLEEVINLTVLNGLIQRSPLGVDTLVGESGVKISGGERQRIGIARALYKRPSILIMDEATSALDSLTEQSIQEVMNRLKGNIAIISIAHRLKTVKDCDLIIYMERGAVVDSGDYLTLYDNSIAFKQYVEAQRI